MFDTESYTDVVEVDGSRMIAVAEGAMGATVDACPGWTVADLVGHVGQVYSFVDAVVAAGGTDMPAVARPEVPDQPADRLTWLRSAHDALVQRLRSTPGDAPCWNWVGTGTAAFFHRRMAHESTIHRWDAESAVDALTPIDSDLGADGVDELIDVGMQHSVNPARNSTYPEGSLHLHRTDGEGEWLLRPGPDGLVVTREHAKGDVAVRGTGDNLLLYLWGRGGDGLEIFGDPALAEAWSHAAP